MFTRISFDLRGMPHRGPYDVDPGMVTGHVELLMPEIEAGTATPRASIRAPHATPCAPIETEEP